MSSAIDDLIRGIEGRSRLVFNLNVRAKHLGNGEFVLSRPDSLDRRIRVKRQININLLHYEHLRQDLDARSEYIDNLLRETFPMAYQR